MLQCVLLRVCYSRRTWQPAGAYLSVCRHYLAQHLHSALSGHRKNTHQVLLITADLWLCTQTNTWTDSSRWALQQFLSLWAWLAVESRPMTSCIGWKSLQTWQVSAHVHELGTQEDDLFLLSWGKKKGKKIEWFESPPNSCPLKTSQCPPLKY